MLKSVASTYLQFSLRNLFKYLKLRRKITILNKTFYKWPTDSIKMLIALLTHLSWCSTSIALYILLKHSINVQKESSWNGLIRLFVFFVLSSVVHVCCENANARARDSGRAGASGRPIAWADNGGTAAGCHSPAPLTTPSQINNGNRQTSRLVALYRRHWLTLNKIRQKTWTGRTEPDVDWLRNDNKLLCIGALTQ